MPYALLHLPSFEDQYLALPPTQAQRVYEKIRLLRDAPEPDAKSKKRLKCNRDLYRLRVGDYRVIYTFGDGVVQLVGVDSRDDVYDDCPQAAPLRITLPPSGVVPEPGPRRDGAPTWQGAAAGTTGTPRSPRRDARDDLPERLTEAMLRRIRVAKEDIPHLVGCTTLDELIAAPVSEASRTKVLNVVTEPDYGQRLESQPTLVTGDAESLLKLMQGELIAFLLKLNPEQEGFVRRAVNGTGPMLLKGGPGTGKSTVALYRVKELVAALRRAGVAQPRILFTTYTNALTASSTQLLGRLLGDDLRLVEVRTADSVAHELVRNARGCVEVATDADQEAMLRAAAGRLAADQPVQDLLARLGPRFLVEEIGRVIDGQDLGTEQRYLEEGNRAGRGVGLRAGQRSAVWRIGEAYHAELARRRKTTWHRLRRQAAAIADGRPAYDAVLVDEAQDLDPVAIRMLVRLCKSADRLFLTADTQQSIYGTRFRWAGIHDDLRFTGRTGTLRTNHRSTPQIDKAAKAYLGSADTEPADAIRWATGYARADGPLPVVRRVASAEEERRLLTLFVREATGLYRLGRGACAVLVPTEQAGRQIVVALERDGIPADFMKGRDLDLEKPAVKVITQHSAKGLEFPIVAVAGFDARAFPGLDARADAERLEAALALARRTCFVAMTRAMLALLVLVPAAPVPPFDRLHAGYDPGLWDLDGTA